MATKNPYNSSYKPGSYGQSPPPYTPKVDETSYTSDSFNVRDKIEQLQSENKRLTRQVRISRGRLGLKTTDLKTHKKEVRNENLNVREQIQQLQNEDKRLVRQVKSCRQGLVNLNTNFRTKDGEIDVEIKININYNGVGERIRENLRDEIRKYKQRVESLCLSVPSEDKLIKFFTVCMILCVFYAIGWIIFLFGLLETTEKIKPAREDHYDYGVSTNYDDYRK